MTRYQKSQLPALRGYSFWLLLSDKSENMVSEWMSRFREAYPSPEFKPHLTLLGLDSERTGNFLQERDLENAAISVASEVRSFQLEMDGIDGNDHPYQPFYIQIKSSQTLISLRKKLIFRLNMQPQPETYNPHVSLLYGNMDQRMRQSLIRDIPVRPSGKLVSAGIGLVRVSGTPESWDMVYKTGFI